MPKVADIGSKRLIALEPTAWARWLIDDPTVEAMELLYSLHRKSSEFVALCADFEGWTG